MSAPALPRADDWQDWGVDPAWSRTLEVASHDGGTHRWHVLERRPAGSERPLGTIVCVHGNPTWSYLWHRVIRRLGGRYHVVAVDQLGMGFSDRLGPRTYAQRVRDLDDVIGALGLQGPLVMVGHDWGGAVVQGWSGRSCSSRSVRIASTSKPSSRAWRMKANRSTSPRL